MKPRHLIPITLLLALAAESLPGVQVRYAADPGLSESSVYFRSILPKIHGILPPYFYFAHGGKNNVRWKKNLSAA